MPAATTVISRTQTKQNNILNVATELFLQRGYDAVSLDDVLEVVGGSKTTLYSYYGSKEGLFAATIRKMYQEKLAPMRDLNVSAMDAKAGLNAIGRCFLTCIIDEKGRAFYRMMVAQAERFPALMQEFFSEGPEMVQTLIRKNLERWQRQGQLRSGSAKNFAVQFLGIMLGDFSTRSLLGLAPVYTEKEIRDWVAQGVTLFLDGASSR